jgi:hypothetical protein
MSLLFLMRRKRGAERVQAVGGTHAQVIGGAEPRRCGREAAGAGRSLRGLTPSLLMGRRRLWRRRLLRRRLVAPALLGRSRLRWWPRILRGLRVRRGGVWRGLLLERSSAGQTELVRRLILSAAASADGHE